MCQISSGSVQGFGFLQRTNTQTHTHCHLCIRFIKPSGHAAFQSTSKGMVKEILILQDPIQDPQLNISQLQVTKNISRYLINDLCQQSRKFSISQVDPMATFLFNNWLLTTTQNCPRFTKIAKVGLKCCQTQIKASNVCRRFLKVCPSDVIWSHC